MNLIRNLIVAIVSLAIFVGMLMAGAFVLLAGLGIGLVALLWMRLRGRQIVNPAEQFGQQPQEANKPQPPTIEADYEVVEESIRFEEKDRV